MYSLAQWKVSDSYKVLQEPSHKRRWSTLWGSSGCVACGDMNSLRWKGIRRRVIPVLSAELAIRATRLAVQRRPPASWGPLSSNGSGLRTFWVFPPTKSKTLRSSASGQIARYVTRVESCCERRANLTKPCFFGNPPSH